MNVTDLRLRAARLQLYALITALLLATGIAAGITTGAFVLSFAVQRDLAHQAGIPQHLTWLFPAIVDGAILGATIAVVALSKIDGATKGKTFFTTLAVAVVVISVYGNAYHAYHGAENLERLVAADQNPGYMPLSPTGAALIAVIPPLLVLAFTHGIGILIKAIGNAYTDYTALIRTPDATPPDATTAVAPSPSDLAHPAPRHTDPTTERGVTGAGVSAAARPEQAVDRGTGDVRVATVAHRNGRAAPETADVASLADVAHLVSAEIAALDDTVAPNPAPGATTHPAPRTTENLLAFLDDIDLDPIVKQTAALKISHPEWTFAALAEKTGAKAASTALRRYKKAEDAALAAGFSIPPLPALEPTGTADRSAETSAVLVDAGAALRVHRTR
ncbi:hypothetical protein Rruber_05417 (plasmid) [Rhodococcus ruber]